MIAEAVFLHRASFPLLKAVASAHHGSQRVDITLKDDPAGGPHNGEACVGLVNEYMAVHPPLRVLVIFFKQVLHLARLNDPYQGGLSSYGVILLLVAFIQLRQAAHLAQHDDESAAGHLLFDFLQFFAGRQCAMMEVSPALPGKTSAAKPAISFLAHPVQLVIVDPLCVTNVVTRALTRSHEVDALFYHLYYTLFRPMGGPLAALTVSATINGCLAEA